MTKKIVSWLAGMAVFLIFSSCRNDVFPEKEAFQNTGSFQLTSRRISLNDSKHKLKLTAEISEAETLLKSLKTNVSGKTISYGNGVSIDTDEVIYIENGPGYHTYTFNIKRENAPGNAPLENLVLSPLTDGSYRELLVTYTLTEQEKQKLMSGIPLDVNGKVDIQEIAQGTYNPGEVLAKSEMSCEWVEETVWQVCSEGLHGGSNAAECYFNTHLNEGTPPIAFTVISHRCKVLTSSTALGDDGTTGGGGSAPSGGLGSGNNDGSGNTGFPSNEPGDCNGGLTAPQTPNYDISDGGCGGGIPTIPNLPNPRNNPCAKTKALLNNPEVKTKLDSLKNKSLSKGEIGFKTRKDGTVTGYISGGKHEVDLGVKAGYQGGYHNHTPAGIPMHSPPDIDNNLLAFARAQPAGEHKNAYFGMIVKKVCTGCPSGYKIYHYIIRFDGTYDDSLTSFSQLDLDNFIADYQKLESAMTNVYGPYGNTYMDSIGNLSNEGLEILFFDTIYKMGLSNKIILQRIEDNGIINNITLNPDGLHTTVVPCL